MSQDTILGTDLGKDALLTKTNNNFSELYADYATLVAGSGVLVTSADDTIGYLNGKLLVGNFISFTVGNAGADETLTIGLPAVVAADALKLIRVNSAGDAYELGNPLGNILIVEDQELSGTDGGTSLAGVNIRVLNTVVTNGITGASLDATAYQVTLPAGTFHIKGDAPCYGGGWHQTYLYNITDGVEIKRGTSIFGSTSYDVYGLSSVETVVTFTASKVLELRHYIVNAASTNGLGVKVSNGTEVYARLFVQQLA